MAMSFQRGELRDPGFAATGLVRAALGRLRLPNRSNIDPGFSGATDGVGGGDPYTLAPATPPLRSEHGAGQGNALAYAAAGTPRLVSEHGAGMGGGGRRPTAPTANQFAVNRLAQLSNLGVTPGMAGVPTTDPAATWRELSPIMGAILQARAGMNPAADLSHFDPAVQQLVAHILAGYGQNAGGVGRGAGSA